MQQQHPMAAHPAAGRQTTRHHLAQTKADVRRVRRLKQTRADVRRVIDSIDSIWSHSHRRLPQVGPSLRQDLLPTAKPPVVESAAGQRLTKPSRIGLTGTWAQ
jgi:hypothetical protein